MKRLFVALAVLGCEPPGRAICETRAGDVVDVQLARDTVTLAGVGLVVAPVAGPTFLATTCRRVR